MVLEENINAQPIILKKRGRKPKNRDLTSLEIEKTNNSNLCKNNINLVTKIPIISKVENTILCFPIKSENNQNLIKKQDDLSTNIEPYPYDPNINFNMYADFENSISHSFAYVSNNDVNKNKNLNLDNFNKNIKIVPILNEFIESNKNKKMPEKTKVCCYWDTEQFDWEPLGLPEKKIGDTFYVKHCFCSFNCMASYNFRINDDKVWERYALINLMYKLMYNINQNVKVKLALPIEALEKFGGIYNINDFRKSCDSKSIKIQSFPLINIQSYLEEINVQLTDTQSSNSISQIEVKNYLDKVNTDYKLSRNKYGSSKNTLEFCMGLKKL